VSDPKPHQPGYEPNLVAVTITRQEALTIARLCGKEARRVSRERAKKPWDASMGSRDMARTRQEKLEALMAVFNDAGERASRPDNRKEPP